MQPHYSSPKSNSSLNRLTRFSRRSVVSLGVLGGDEMNESTRTYDSGRCTAPWCWCWCWCWSLRPLILSNDETCGEVGEVVGDAEGEEILVLILVVRVRRSGMLVGRLVE
jgi:hypothetical protein